MVLLLEEVQNIILLVLLVAYQLAVFGRQMKSMELGFFNWDTTRTNLNAPMHYLVCI